MSPEPTDVSRIREAIEAIARSGPVEAECVPPEAIWDAANGAATATEVDRVAAHALTCSACAEAWRLARALAPAARARPAAPPLRWTAGWAALAAAAAIAVAFLAPWGARRDGSVVPGYRAEPVEAVRSEVPPDAALPRDDVRLRWTGPEGATFDLEVATGDLEIVARVQGLTVPEYAVPEALLAGVPSGSRLVWRVEAVSPAGRRIASRTFVIRLE